MKEMGYKRLGAGIMLASSLFTAWIIYIAIKTIIRVIGG